MQVKVVKDCRYDNIYDVYYKRWGSWLYQYYLSAKSLEHAQEKVNGKLAPPSLTWKV